MQAQKKQEKPWAFLSFSHADERLLSVMLVGDCQLLAAFGAA